MSTGWLVVILGLALAFPAPAVLGQDESAASPPTGADAAAEDATATEPPIVETSTEAATVEPTQIPPIATAPAEQTGETPAATETPSAASPATLSYAPAQTPDCKTVDNRPETVTSGDFLDYDCTFAVHLSTANLDPGAIVLTWTVNADAGDWTVQLNPPATADDPDPRWTVVADDVPVRFSLTARPTDVETVASAEIDEQLRFGLRVHRPVCALEPVAVRLDAAVTAAAPDLPTAVVTRIDPAPLAEPFRLTPTLAPAPEPVIAFGGALDFGEVPVDALGVRQQPAPQTITLTVSKLDAACGDWTLTLTSDSFAGDDGSPIPKATLALTTIDGVVVADGGCPLDGGCDVAMVAAGPDADATVTYTLGISLILPDQVHATTFNSTLTASLAPKAP